MNYPIESLLGGHIPLRISQHAFGPVSLLYCVPACCKPDCHPAVIVFLVVSAFWERCVAPSPQRLASRCWLAGRPNSDPAGWMPESEPSPHGTQRSHLPALPQSLAAPAPAPKASEITSASETLKVKAFIQEYMMDREDEPGRLARYQEEAEGHGRWVWAVQMVVDLMTEGGWQWSHLPSSGTQ